MIEFLSTWGVGIAAYTVVVWLFLRFFHFVSDCDRDIEQMQGKPAAKR